MLRHLQRALQTASWLFLSVMVILFAPWQSTYGSIKAILATTDPREKDRLTSLWRDTKLSELSFVCVASALVAAVIASAFSWLTAPKNPYPTTILWLCGLVLAVTSISAAAQQSIALSRLNSHPEGLRQIRRQLGGPVSLRSSTDRGEVVGRNVAWKPSLLQVYVWQVPVMMLNFSILMFLAGLGWSVWDAALKKGPTWEEDIKVAVACTMAGAFAAINYVVSMVCIYHRTLKFKD